MCGLTGIIMAESGAMVDERLLLAMRDVQTHRGPDEAGLYRAPGVGLGHRRLAIIDLAHGQQPMVDEAAGLALVYNGELYNYRELAAELASHGVAVTSDSDTEVVLRAWQHWGDKCLPRLRGMFAFALWDMRERCLVLARDPLGIKPLYHGFTRGGDLLFASELKGVLAHPGVAREIDPQALEAYLALGYVPDPGSIYRGIRKLPPGCWLSWRAGRPEPVPQQYWDVPFVAHAGRDEAEAVEQLRQRMDAAVASQMVADVPLGAFLSGGVDSSAVVASMSRRRSGVHTCAIGFKQADFDESRYARQVAEHLGTQHFEQRVDADDHDLIDTLAVAYDEPFADSSALPTWRLCQMARGHVTVALSGDGGDENFAGYRRYRMHAAESRLRAALPAGLRQPLFGTLGRIYPKADWAPRPLRAKTTLQALARDDVAAYFQSVSHTTPAQRQGLYSAAFRRELAGYDALSVFRAHAEHAPVDEPLKLAQYLDMKTWLPGDILTKVDRASMAHSLEVRVPVLDQDFVAWAFGLPSAWCLRGGEGKSIFKKALERDLPHDVLYRPKMGFRIPLADWLRGPLRGRLMHTLESGMLAESGFFDVAGLRRMAHQHLSGRRDHSPGLWGLMMLDAFLNKDQPVVSAQGFAVPEPARGVA